MARIPTCHPDRPHQGLGLCGPCYWKEYAQRPEVKVRAKVYFETRKEHYRLYQQQYWKRRILKPGDKYKDRLGYVVIVLEGNIRRREHRVILEGVLGRSLLSTEVVHHKDGNPSNNSLDNLVLFPTNSVHLQHHRELRRQTSVRA